MDLVRLEAWTGEPLNIVISGEIALGIALVPSAGVEDTSIRSPVSFTIVKSITIQINTDFGWQVVYLVVTCYVRAGAGC